LLDDRTNNHYQQQPIPQDIIDPGTIVHAPSTAAMKALFVSIDHGDDDDTNTTTLLKQIVPPIATMLFVVMAAVAWYRKRQYDRKGYHKKKESFSS
jgi:hypothetical protein